MRNAERKVHLKCGKSERNLGQKIDILKCGSGNQKTKMRMRKLEHTKMRKKKAEKVIIKISCRKAHITYRH